MPSGVLVQRMIAKKPSRVSMSQGTKRVGESMAHASQPPHKRVAPVRWTGNTQSSSTITSLPTSRSGTSTSLTPPPSGTVVPPLSGRVVSSPTPQPYLTRITDDDALLPGPSSPLPNSDLDNTNITPSALRFKRANAVPLQNQHVFRNAKAILRGEVLAVDL